MDLLYVYQGPGSGTEIMRSPESVAAKDRIALHVYTRTTRDEAIAETT